MSGLGNKHDALCTAGDAAQEYSGNGHRYIARNPSAVVPSCGTRPNVSLAVPVAHVDRRRVVYAFPLTLPRSQNTDTSVDSV